MRPMGNKCCSANACDRKRHDIAKRQTQNLGKKTNSWHDLSIPYKYLFENLFPSKSIANHQNSEPDVYFLVQLQVADLVRASRDRMGWQQHELIGIGLGISRWWLFSVTWLQHPGDCWNDGVPVGWCCKRFKNNKIYSNICSYYFHILNSSTWWAFQSFQCSVQHRLPLAPFTLVHLWERESL